MALYYEEAGAGDPVFLVHGLFGASTNLRRMAKALAERFRVVSVDLPNHGRSAHTESMTYADMRRALLEVMDRVGVTSAHWVGHSMGGKAVMDLALTEPETVSRLVVMDIAPVEYPHSHLQLIDALSALDLESLRSRADAERALGASIPDAPTRLFLLQNLHLQDGRYRWRLNLPVLRDFLKDIMGFPEHAGGVYSGPVLFLSGERSDYVRPVDHAIIKMHFPHVAFDVIGGAGHWLHADRPDEVCAALLRFLTDKVPEN